MWMSIPAARSLLPPPLFPPVPCFSCVGVSEDAYFLLQGGGRGGFFAAHVDRRIFSFFLIHGAARMLPAVVEAQGKSGGGREGKFALLNCCAYGNLFGLYLYDIILRQTRWLCWSFLFRRLFFFVPFISYPRDCILSVMTGRYSRKSSLLDAFFFK